MVITYGIPEGFPRSELYAVTVNGQEAAVGHTDAADFACLATDGPLDVEVTVASPPGTTAVRPLSRGITPSVHERRVVFRLPCPGSVSVEPEKLPPLFLFAGPPEQDPPSRSDPAVRWFGDRRVHDVGELVLQSGETLYVEGGAAMRGHVVARQAHDVTVRGAGIIDGIGLRQRKQWRRGVLFEDCDRVRVEGVSIVNSPGWTLVFHACHGAHVAGVNEIGEGLGTDGIDVVSSRDVVVQDCFLRNGDDNLVVKAFAPAEGRGRGGDVDNVLFERCTLLGHGGCAMEIGHELRTDEIRNVTFRDCDVLGIHGHGAAIGIHNADHATVRDITFESIRVEHHFTRLIDLRVIASRYGKDSERGRIRGVRIRNVRVTSSPYNAGYTVSLIGGYDAAHDVRDVTIEGLYMDGRKATGPDDIDLYVRHATGIEFR